MNAVVPAVVNLLCMASSAVCAVLLVRSWLKSRARLLLWTSICIGLLAVSNILLVANLILPPRIDLSEPRLVIALAAVSVLLFGFIREA